VYAWRDRLVADARFQRWAAAFPLTRFTARRHARGIFDLCAGFVYSQILLACVQLRLFDHLAAGPRRADELSPGLGLDLAATRRLLDAAVALKLLVRRSGDRYGLAMAAAALRGNPGAIAMIEHHAMVYRDLADPVGLLRGELPETGLSRYWPYAVAADATTLQAEQVGAYTRLMATSQTLIADDILAAYDFGRHQEVLDVGGGDGTFLASVGAAHPAVRLSLFDLPAGAGEARARFKAAGLAHRARATGGDFAADPLPAGADVATLVRVLLDHTDAGALAILRGIRTALPAGGTLVVAEPMRNLPGAETVGDAYFGFYLLAMRRGQARSPVQLQALMEAAGFEAVRSVPTRRPLLTGMMTARVPASQDKIRAD
jgi:demethylspheroidene O-methyltransferase